MKGRIPEKASMFTNIVPYPDLRANRDTNGLCQLGNGRGAVARTCARKSTVFGGPLGSWHFGPSFKEEL